MQVVTTALILEEMAEANQIILTTLAVLPLFLVIELNFVYRSTASTGTQVVELGAANRLLVSQLIA